MSTAPLLFSVEEAFMRLGQMKTKGSLLVFSATESGHIYVQEGLVVAAISGKLTGEEALDHALKLPNAAYRWVPEAEPAARDMRVDILEYIWSHDQENESRGKTINIGAYDKKEKKPEFRYFFVPENAPSLQLPLKKATSVAGRESGCDLFLDSLQVSRRHCLMQITERGLLVKDLGSTNGTFVNGIPLADGYINDGDRLGLGTYVITLRREKIPA